MTLRASVLEALTTSLAGRLTYDVVRTALGAWERLLHVISLTGSSAMLFVYADYTSSQRKEERRD